MGAGVAMAHLPHALFQCSKGFVVVLLLLLLKAALIARRQGRLEAARRA